MKIGILTLPLHRNYGGILQNWTFQHALKDMAHEPEMIFLCGGYRPKGKLLVLRCMSLVNCIHKTKRLTENVDVARFGASRGYDAFHCWQRLGMA